MVTASGGLYRINDAHAVERLKAYGFSMDEIYRLVAPRRTLARRLQMKEPLTIQENDSLLRVERIVEAALRVFGDAEKAGRWLRKPCRALQGVVPIEILPSESGALLVEQELIRIEHGIFA
jgi:putative toxin-antitoxin system antitoxin component (TIGR02293 family)